jgi:hypothetical protein
MSVGLEELRNKSLLMNLQCHRRGGDHNRLRHGRELEGANFGHGVERRRVRRVEAMATREREAKTK